MKKTTTKTTMAIQVNGTEEFSRDLHKPESCAGMSRNINACDYREISVASFLSQ
jgi:hypothetical protein